MARTKLPRSICRACGKVLVRREARYCNNQCQNDYEYHHYIQCWLAGDQDGNTGGYHISKHIRRYMLEQAGNQCEKCGWSKINEHTGKVPLTVSHINGNWQDSRRENLEVLCPNCHSLTETYCARNKGNGRPRYKR